MMLWLVSLCSSSQLLRCRVPGRRALCAFLRSPGCTLLGSEAPPSFGQQRRAQKLCCCCWRLLDEISGKGLKLQCIVVVSLCPTSCLLCHSSISYSPQRRRPLPCPGCRARQIESRVVDMCSSCSAIGFAGCRFPICHGHCVGCSYPS